MLLVIDNYDSFHNLVQYLGELGERCAGLSSDQITLTRLRTYIRAVL